jgi:hypothetical protein
MTKTREPRQPHWAIPQVSRPRSAATDLYPYLRTERGAAPRAKQKAKGLLLDATRQHVSPLGGTAEEEKR